MALNPTATALVADAEERVDYWTTQYSNACLSAALGVAPMWPLAEARSNMEEAVAARNALFANLAG